jgi:hypothetical protein
MRLYPHQCYDPPEGQLEPFHCAPRRGLVVDGQSHNLDPGFSKLLICALKPRKLGLTIGAPGPSVNQHSTMRSLEGLTDTDCAAANCRHIEGRKG